jgi:acetyl-CoA decarbonylase/synthase complex subunit gamma
MALKASDIQKKLPDGGKKNCKECGFPTCFAFAMKLAVLAVSPDKCPYLAAEVKEEMMEALAPPIKLVTIGTGEKAVTIGEEEVVYRHEKTFHRAPGLGLTISDSEEEKTALAKIAKLTELRFDRIGQQLQANFLAVKYGGRRDKYLALVAKAGETGFPLVLICAEVEVLLAARDLVAEQKPLLYPVTKDNLEALLPRLQEKPTPVGVKAAGLAELAALTTRLKEAGITDLVLDPSPANLAAMIRDYTLIRRSALKKGFRPLGYPIISLPAEAGGEELDEVMLAAAGVIKYAGLVVLSDFDRALLYPLLVLRQNVYTDPRVPLAVEQKVYEIGAVTADSPVFLTTNFALTYFAVANELENSKIPSYLCVKDTEGLCVLAAWSTGKLNGETVAPFMKKSGIAEKVSRKRLVIPGLAARIKGELEEELPEWEIVVGPREASDLPVVLPKMLEKWQSQGR